MFLALFIFLSPVVILAETQTLVPAVHDVWDIPWDVSQEEFRSLAYAKIKHDFWPYPELSPRDFFIWHLEYAENVLIFGYQPSIIHISFLEGKFSSLTTLAFFDIDVKDTEQIANAFDSLLSELSSRYEPSSPPFFIYSSNEDGKTYYGIPPFNLDGRMNADFLSLLIRNEPQSTLYLEYDNIYAQIIYEFDIHENQFYYEIKLAALSQYSSMSMWETLENDPTAHKIDNYLKYIQESPTPIPEFTPTPIPAPINTRPLLLHPSSRLTRFQPPHQRQLFLIFSTRASRKL